MPPVFGGRILILLARFNDLDLRIGLGGVLEGGRLHLLREQFLIDQAVKDGPALVLGKLADRTAAQKSFVAQRIIPIALQDDVAVDGSDNPVDDFARSGA